MTDLESLKNREWPTCSALIGCRLLAAQPPGFSGSQHDSIWQCVLFLLFVFVRNKGEKYYLQLGHSPAATRVS